MIATDFVIPKWVKVEEGATERYARFAVEPFERGYGTTIGNSLRRVLLASLGGSAVTAIRLEGIHHEFSAIPGVKEDVTDVVLNLKRCQLRLNRDEALIYLYSRKGEGAITAGDLFKGQDVTVFNPDQLIMTTTSKSTQIEMEIKVDKGRGFVTADQFELEHAPVGTIYLDANFSPVTKVNFVVEDARVGQTTDYDRLILEVWTNGSIMPEQAVQEAADLLIEHLRIFTQQQAGSGDDLAGGAAEDPEFQRLMNRPVEELELSVRAANCLKAANIRTIRDLISRDESEMLQFHNFGKKSLDEIKAILESLGLELGMNLSDGSRPAAQAQPVSSAAEEEEVEADAEVE
jgi:DNA-directed RNA polymerase subunit alpha